MKLYKTTRGLFVETDGNYFELPQQSLDELIAREDIAAYLAGYTTGKPAAELDATTLLAPVGQQEVWAAGVTYLRSRSARIEESKSAAGGDFYDRVYSAPRPELFFKALPHKVVGTNSSIRIRKDATWSVPEPELAVLVSPKGSIVGYTVANDVSSSDIEGENQLYLPQAKVYDRSCALGPGILIHSELLPPDTQISLNILRAGATVFSETIAISAMKRQISTLVEFLFRDQTFAYGCFLLTGTGIVPPDSFGLRKADEVRIRIGPIGELVNTVE